jgi:hypothetical protein
MHTITIEITDNSAMKTIQSLENKHFIRVIENTDFASLPGKPLSMDEFRHWINAAEQTPSVSLNQAKEKWQQKRNQLLKLLK